MNLAIIDTDILSYAFDQRYPEVTANFHQYIRVYRYPSISALTFAEVIRGLERVQDTERLARFYSQSERIEIFPLDVPEAKMAGEILGALERKGMSIGPLDPFIAATAIVNDRELITNNVRHYARIVDLGFPLRLNNWRLG